MKRWIVLPVLLMAVLALFSLAGCTSTVTVLSPNGGEKFVQGEANKISWSGGRDVVQIGLVEESATNYVNPGGDPYLIVGWINTEASPNNNINWDGKLVYDLAGNFPRNVMPGTYKIIAVSKDTDGNYILWNAETNKPGNWDVSDAPFSIIRPM